MDLKRNLKGFTLAEIMIVLTVIGILTAIILPSARNLMPDRNLMKFKKAHNTLGTAITELVNSNKYYLNGDLGKKPDGNYIDNSEYFCRTLSDLLNSKKINCSETKLTNLVGLCTMSNGVCQSRSYSEIGQTLDNLCKTLYSAGEQIVLPDNVVLYEPASYWHFGAMLDGENYSLGTYKAGEDGRVFTSVDEKGFYRFLKVFCIDIDGIHASATKTNCINECSFGYGVRIDGKIFTGARALEWLEKDVSQN